MGNKFSSSTNKQKVKNDKIYRNKGTSIASSFRRSVSFRRMSWAPRPHLDCRSWLTQLQLTQYIDAFSKYSGVEELLYFDERRIRDEIGVKISSDRAKICTSLVCLREKYEKHQKLKVDYCPRISLNIEPLTRPSYVDLSPDVTDGVVLRYGKRSKNPYTQKREAIVISPDEEEKEMNFNSIQRQESNELELRQLLELELSLDSSDLRSHAWYHGAISRARAEEIVVSNGSFLIRDCISQPGDFVLTCRWNNQVIHVIIQKTIVQPNTIYEKIQYKLEDVAYDSIPDLVTAYVGSRRPVTQLSGARISMPINRSAPLSFYISKYAAQAEFTRLHGTLSRPSSKCLVQSRPGPFVIKEPVPVTCSFIRTYSKSPTRLRRSSGTASKVQRPSSGLFEDAGIESKTTPDKNESTTHSLPRRFMSSTFSLPQSSLIPEDQSNKKNQSNNSLSTMQDLNPPPKPSRVPSMRRDKPELREKRSPERSETAKSESDHSPERIYTEIDEIETKTSISVDTLTKNGENTVVDGTNGALNSKNGRLSEVYQSSGSDSGNGSGDSIQTSASDCRNRDSQFSFCDTGSLTIEDDSLSEEQTCTLPESNPPSAFDLENFSTLLLPAIENRPLDSTAFTAVNNTLKETGSRVLAAHLTKADLDLLNCSPGKNYGLGVSLGVEFITLPQGSQLRKDIIERTECLKLLVAVTVLKLEDVNERAEMIYHWIQIAIDTKIAMGNLYGFTGIMLGLCTPEIQRLTQTWHIVRQKFTDSAFEFESKLRATMKAMNECSNPQAPNTTIPHILPFVLLWERDLEDIYSVHTKNDSLFQWESTACDYGLQVLLNHLQEGMNFTKNLSIYRRNAELVFGENMKIDDLIFDVFKTEFHLKFLFGSKAAFAESEQRLPKFQRVIATLSEFCEPSQ